MASGLVPPLTIVGGGSSDALSHTAAPPRKMLGRVLVEIGALSTENLLRGLDLQRRVDARLGDILIAEGLISESELQAALSEQHDAPIVNLDKDPPQAGMSGHLSPTFCLRHGVLPWRIEGDVLELATSSPDQMEHVRRALPDTGFAISPVLTPQRALWRHQARIFAPALAWLAERRVPEHLSCRWWSGGTVFRSAVAVALISFLVLCAALFTTETIIFFSALALGTLILSAGLKIAAALAQLTMRRRPISALQDREMRLPKVSVMVPLLRESEIAQTLIKRLSRLTYPKALLDVVLVLEEDDSTTRETLARTHLPNWMRVIEVPRSDGLTTKPRALNYALDFCRGSLIGIWDAEDAPEPDQIEEVVRHFNAAGPEVACLQGALDYYNPRANWLARCFTIEYATWWRLIIPGIAKLGLVVPLGGTTLFFRRETLLELGGWDAHNVTEDADLGVRLARAGYRTEIIPTVTYEEANCRVWPWIRQRSRWLKGFAITWAVHMQRPMQTLKELGLYRFLGLQVFFLAALSQFALAPVFWSFWLIPLGLPHPAATALPASWVTGAAVLFISIELTSILIGMIAVSRRSHRHLIPWVPSLILYFPLGCIAMYKAMFELIAHPFFWDKTQHGVSR